MHMTTCIHMYTHTDIDTFYILLYTHAVCMYVPVLSQRFITVQTTAYGILWYICIHMYVFMDTYTHAQVKEIELVPNVHIYIHTYVYT